MAPHMRAESVIDALKAAVRVRDAIAIPPARTTPQVAHLGPGREMAEHAQLRIDSGLDIYFCDPRSPW